MDQLVYYTTLRQQAEILLQSRAKTERSDGDRLKLLHELEVHEIELEMTIDELSRQNQELENQANELAKVNFSLVWQQTLEQRNAELSDKNSELHINIAEKNKFLSIIAHDLRSPLSSITGLSEILLEHIKDNNNNRIEEYATLIKKSSFRAMNLLTDLMEWVRSMTGRIEFKPRYFDMAFQIEDISQIFVEIARLKSISILIESPPVKPVYADKDMISTILRNLISNAIKFSFPEGRIIISSKENRNELIISIKDSGIGMTKEHIDKIFRFDEIYSTPGTNKELGTGLGLILCKEFAEKHGGRIWVRSEKGKGSEFKFAIPVKEQ